MRTTTERLKMANGNGLNLRAIGLVITLLFALGGFVGGYYIQRDDIAEAKDGVAENKTSIVDTNDKLDISVKEIQGDISNVKDDMSDVKIDVAKLQIDVEIIKDDNKYMRGRLDYIVEELAKQNRGS